MAAIVSLLVVIFISMLITRVATIALTATGLSRQSARFQARSALTGAGFTTSESESVVRHPVRRRIVMLLMLIGSAGIAAVIASTVLAFVDPDDAGAGWSRVLVLVLGIVGLWVLATSAFVDRAITRLTVWALKRYTSIDARDYASLLHLGADYIITEFPVPPGHWLTDRSLAALALRKEAVIVLGVVQSSGEYLGVPKGETVLRAGDTLVLYSRAGRLEELDQRRKGPSGETAHLHAVDEAREVADQERARTRREP